MTVVNLAFFDLRCPIAARPDIFNQFVNVIDCRMVEVGHFKVKLLVYQDVLTFEIQVSHFFSMKMVEHIKHLMKEEPACDFADTCELLVEAAEVPAGDILEPQVDPLLYFLAR